MKGAIVRKGAGRRGRDAATSRRWRGLVVGLAAVAALTGCSASTEEQAARETAVHFAASSNENPQAACADLAPFTQEEVEQTARRPCDEALVGEQLPPSTEVVRTVLAGHSAMVELEAQTVFLARFDDGWKVVAAGCSRNSDDDAVPYECLVKGR